MEEQITNSSRKITAELIFPEIEFSTARSGGPGGQNVNKVNSKVIARFDIGKSRILTEDEKSFLMSKLAAKISDEGVISLSAQESRSQFDNRETVIQKLDKILDAAYVVRKPRKKTKPSKAAKQKRIESKKKQSEKKKWRQKF